MKIQFIEYDETFLHLSKRWLRDPEIKRLTMTPDIDDETQRRWFETLNQRKDYLIWGILADKKPIGAVGIKNIDQVTKNGEYWGYIGEKAFIGQGIGRHMVETMVDNGKNIGLKTLTLKVANYNQRAYALYKNMGFEVIATEDTVNIMEKRL